MQQYDLLTFLLVVSIRSDPENGFNFTRQQNFGLNQTDTLQTAKLMLLKR